MIMVMSAVAEWTIFAFGFHKKHRNIMSLKQQGSHTAINKINMITAITKAVISWCVFIIMCAEEAMCLSVYWNAWGIFVLAENNLSVSPSRAEGFTYLPFFNKTYVPPFFFFRFMFGPECPSCECTVASVGIATPIISSPEEGQYRITQSRNSYWPEHSPQLVQLKILLSYRADGIMKLSQMRLAIRALGEIRKQLIACLMADISEYQHPSLCRLMRRTM